MVSNGGDTDGGDVFTDSGCGDGIDPDPDSDLWSPFGVERITADVKSGPFTLLCRTAPASDVAAAQTGIDARRDQTLQRNPQPSSQVYFAALL